MRFAPAVSLLALALSLVNTTWAQSADPEILKQKIRALEKELEETKTVRKPISHVTQIGGPRGPERRDDQIVRLYDLSDLFAVAPPYEAERPEGLGASREPLFPRPAVAATGSGTGGMGGMGGGMFNTRDPGAMLPDAEHNTLHQNRGAGVQSGSPAAGAAVSMDDLIGAITGTISPASWSDDGGPGSISRLGNALLISSTRQNHEQIDALLQLFRQRWGTLRTISVRAWWLWLDERQASDLLAGPAAGGEERPVFGLVDANKWNELQSELIGADKPEHTGYRASLTCYNGQTVSTQTVRQSLAVINVQPKTLAKQKDNEMELVTSYQPVTNVVQEGASLQITPISNTSGNYVVLDLHSEVSSLLGGAHAEGRANAMGDTGPRAAIQAIDRPRLATQLFATTLRVPANQLMLVGGITSDSPPDPQRPNLFLFVKATVQELRDDRESKEIRRPGEREDTGAPAEKTHVEEAPSDVPSGGEKPANE